VAEVEIIGYVRDMSADQAALAVARKSLTRELARRACRDRIAISFSHDTDALDKCGRLYQSSVGGRGLNIDYDPDSAAEIACSVQDPGAEAGRNGLLTVTVNDPAADRRQLWRIVKAWLYDRTEAGALLPA
jgi:hypothetical protein